MIVDKSSPFLVSDSPSYGTSETNPTYGGVTASTSLPSYNIPSTTTPLLVTPEIEPYKAPVKGSGASVVAEPQLGTPIVKNDTPSPVGTGGIGTAPKPTNTGGGIGGGIGGGAGSGAGSDTGVMTNMPKKPNYLLYGGILLAVIVAYKLLSSEK
jgi:hypothetical protein